MDVCDRYYSGIIFAKDVNMCKFSYKMDPNGGFEKKGYKPENNHS